MNIFGMVMRSGLCLFLLEQKKTTSMVTATQPAADDLAKVIHSPVFGSDESGMRLWVEDCSVLKTALDFMKDEDEVCSKDFHVLLLEPELRFIYHYVTTCQFELDASSGMSLALQLDCTGTEISCLTETAFNMFTTHSSYVFGKCGAMKLDEYYLGQVSANKKVNDELLQGLADELNFLANITEANVTEAASGEPPFSAVFVSCFFESVNGSRTSRMMVQSFMRWATYCLSKWVLLTFLNKCFWKKRNSLFKQRFNKLGTSLRLFAELFLILFSRDSELAWDHLSTWPILGVATLIIDCLVVPFFQTKDVYDSLRKEIKKLETHLYRVYQKTTVLE
jgi:hypothetical protein